MKDYARGDYKGAMRWFKYSARYADKLSQLSVGLMYTNGLGVAKDPTTGCAWLAIAAQRDFPQYVATRNQVCSSLTHAELAKAKVAAEKLLPIYGDKVAKHRMAVVLQRDRDNKTGSRTGFGTVAVLAQNTFDFTRTTKFGGSSLKPTRNNCMATTIGGSPVKGCGGSNFYAADRVEPKQYFATRDHLWSPAPQSGTATVGPLKQIHQGPDEKPQLPAPATPPQQ